VLSFDPGVIEHGAGVDEEVSCPSAIQSFSFSSAVSGSAKNDREIIMVDGQLSPEDLFVEIMWVQGDQRSMWQSLEAETSRSHWLSLLELPLITAKGDGRTRSRQLTVVHKGGCSRTGQPSNIEPWIELEDVVQSTQSGVDIDTSTGSVSAELGIREQVVFALELAPDIKSVKLHCQNGWQERTGVRDGRARFTEVPRVECQAGWIGDRRGWVLIDADAEILRCLFEPDQVVCDSL
jgi:hypothetical protein